MASNHPPSIPALPGHHDGRPPVSSSLQVIFPSYGSSVSAPRSPPTEEATIIKDANISAKMVTRGRGESRSSSVPPMTIARHRDFDVLKPENKRSVKHLTCFWWKEKGICRFSDEECLYAHYDTGRYTEAPRQINPDEPAKAGRNLDYAIARFSLNRSSASLSSLGRGPSGHGDTGMIGHTRGSTHSSNNLMIEAPFSRINLGGGGGTPSGRIPTPTPEFAAYTPAYVQQLQADCALFRNLADQSLSKKQAIVNYIKHLENCKTELREKLEIVTQENETLVRERDDLAGRLSYLTNPAASGRGPYPANPYGVIGSGMMGRGQHMW